jgi:hypothetical protein
MRYPQPPLYIDQQHRLLERLKAHEAPVPFACRNGHALREKPSGALECQGCGMIFHGYLVKEDA